MGVGALQKWSEYPLNLESDTSYLETGGLFIRGQHWLLHCSWHVVLCFLGLFYFLLGVCKKQSVFRKPIPRVERVAMIRFLLGRLARFFCGQSTSHEAFGEPFRPGLWPVGRSVGRFLRWRRLLASCFCWMRPFPDAPIRSVLGQTARF